MARFHPSGEQLWLVGHHQQHPIPAQLAQQLQHLVAHRPVQAGGGLIEQQHPRIPQQLHRQRQPPLLAATEALRCLLQREALQTHLPQHRLGPLGGQTALAQLQLLAHREAQEMAFRKLEHQPAEPAPLPGAQGLPLPEDLAALGFGQATDQLQQRGFAAAAAARHQGGGSRPERQAGPPQHRLGRRGGLVVEGSELEHGWPHWPAGGPSMFDGVTLCLLEPRRDGDSLSGV